MRKSKSRRKNGDENAGNKTHTKNALKKRILKKWKKIYVNSSKYTRCDKDKQTNKQTKK